MVVQKNKDPKDREFEHRGYASCFIPTHYHGFANALFLSRGYLTPVEFYDFVRFVEDFVLADTLVVPQQTYFIAESNIRRHDDECREYFGSIERNLIPHLYEQRTSFYLVPDNPRALNGAELDQLKEKVEAGGDFLQVLGSLGRGRPAEEWNFEEDNISLFREHLYLYDKPDQPSAWKMYSSPDLHQEIISDLRSKSRTLHWAANISDLLASRNFSLSPGVGMIAKLDVPPSLPRREIYDAIAQHFKVKIEKLYRSTRTHPVYIPPLLAILLSRMKTMAEFPEAMVQLRREFSDLRNEIGRFERSIAAADTLREKLILIEELENSQEVLSKKIAGKTQKTLIRRSWDIFKGLTPSKIATNFLDAMFEQNEEKIALNRIRRYIDMYSIALDTTADYERHLERLFGGRMYYWDKLPALAEAVSVSINAD